MRKPPATLPRGLLHKPVHMLSLGFGAGCAPVAPGTFGTLLGVVLYLVLRELPPPAYVAAVMLLFALGVWLCGRTAARLGMHDHPAIVWDEVVGYLITMIAAPPGWVWVAAGFVLFRLFDILKPWPIRWFDQRVRGGLGIMLDDAVAAIVALTCVHISAYLLYSYKIILM